jgi:sulfhydrogenase subunit delta
MTDREFRKGRKLKVGWFTFTCCEGCAIVFIELFNDHFTEWKDRIDFRHVKLLKSKNEIRDLDLAIVEGAISTQKDLDWLLEIRKNSKYVVAVGSCAITGMPAGLRNSFNEKQRKEISPILKKFGYLGRVEPVSKYIEIDSKVHGCPMNGNMFAKEINSYLEKVSGAKE